MFVLFSVIHFFYDFELLVLVDFIADMFIINVLFKVPLGGI